MVVTEVNCSIATKHPYCRCPTAWVFITLLTAIGRLQEAHDMAMLQSNSVSTQTMFGL